MIPVRVTAKRITIARESSKITGGVVGAGIAFVQSRPTFQSGLIVHFAKVWGRNDAKSAAVNAAAASFCLRITDLAS